MYGDYVPLAEYIKHDDACVIFAADIKDNERVGPIPNQGWNDFS